MAVKAPEARILALRARRGVVSTSDVARVLDVSRQAAHRRLRALADQGQVLHQGGGRAARWVLPDASSVTFEFATAGLAEDRVRHHLSRQGPALASPR